jgi:hypothetical protein
MAQVGSDTEADNGAAGGEQAVCDPALGGHARLVRRWKLFVRRLEETGQKWNCRAMDLRWCRTTGRVLADHAVVAAVLVGSFGVWTLTIVLGVVLSALAALKLVGFFGAVATHMSRLSSHSSPLRVCLLEAHLVLGSEDSSWAERARTLESVLPWVEFGLCVAIATRGLAAGAAYATAAVLRPSAAPRPRILLASVPLRQASRSRNDLCSRTPAPLSAPLPGPRRAVPRAGAS